MKVMIARQSGLPVDEAKAEQYRAEWQKEFDLLKEKHGADMLALQEELVLLERELEKDYETVSTVELPKTGKAWKAFVEKYGSVLLSTHRDTEKVILIIMDQGI